MRNLAAVRRVSKANGQGVVFPAGERFGRHQPPFALRPTPGNACRPRKRGRRASGRTVRASGRACGIDLRPADDEHLLVPGKQRDGLLRANEPPVQPGISICWRVMTTLVRLGSGRPSDSQVLRPMIDRMARRHGLEMLSGLRKCATAGHSCPRSRRFRQRQR